MKLRPYAVRQWHAAVKEPGGEYVRLETTEVIEIKEAIHGRFRVIK